MSFSKIDFDRKLIRFIWKQFKCLASRMLGWNPQVISFLLHIFHIIKTDVRVHVFIENQFSMRRPMSSICYLWLRLCKHLHFLQCVHRYRLFLRLVQLIYINDDKVKWLSVVVEYSFFARVVNHKRQHIFNCYICI